MARPVAPSVRSEVIAAFFRHRESGMQHREALAATASECSVSTATVGRLVRAHRAGESLAPKPPRGRARKLSAADVEQVQAWLRVNPDLSLYEVAEKLQAEGGVKAHPETIGRRLREVGWSKRRLTREVKAAQVAAGEREKKPDRYTDRHRRKPTPKPHRRGYPSDLTDEEWALAEPLWRAEGVRMESTRLRDIIDAITYVERTGCQWRYLPNEFPPSSTVRRIKQDWTRSGLLDRVHTRLRERVRVAVGRQATPSAAIIDSQSTKTAHGGEEVGYDGGKKVKGRKRHVLVDMLGLVLAVVVHTAGIQDRAGAAQLLTPGLSEQFPRLEVAFGDQAYTGELLRQINETYGYRLEVIHRNGDNPRGQWVGPEKPEATKATGFQVVPKRWIVERTFGWWVFWRRTSKEYERLTCSSVGNILWLSSARMLSMLAKT